MTQTIISLGVAGLAVAIMGGSIYHMRKTQPEAAVSVPQYLVAVGLTLAAVALAFDNHVLASVVAITLLPTLAALAWTDLVYRRIPLPLIVVAAAMYVGAQFWIHPALDVAPWALAGVAMALGIRLVAPRIGTDIGLADLVVIALCVMIFREVGLIVAAVLFALPVIARRKEVPLVSLASIAALASCALVTIV